MDDEKTQYEEYLKDEKKFEKRFKREEDKLMEELESFQIPSDKERKIVKNNFVFYFRKFLKNIGLIREI